MVLQTLATMGPLHGYGIARRIEQLSEDAILLNQGTIYASLVRLQQRGWIKAEWGISATNRRVRIYKLTAAGSKHLQREVSRFEKMLEGITRVLAPGES